MLEYLCCATKETEMNEPTHERFDCTVCQIARKLLRIHLLTLSLVSAPTPSAFHPISPLFLGYCLLWRNVPLFIDLSQLMTSHRGSDLAHGVFLYRIPTFHSLLQLLCAHRKWKSNRDFCDVISPECGCWRRSICHFYSNVVKHGIQNGCRTTSTVDEPQSVTMWLHQ